MKTCCICHREAPAEQATCLSCGEASWSSLSSSAAKSAPQASVEETADEAPKKRGRR